MYLLGQVRKSNICSMNNYSSTEHTPRRHSTCRQPRLGKHKRERQRGRDWLIDYLPGEDRETSQSDIVSGYKEWMDLIRQMTVPSIPRQRKRLKQSWAGEVCVCVCVCTCTCACLFQSQAQVVWGLSDTFAPYLCFFFLNVDNWDMTLLTQELLE